ncbi:hypothetical protein [Roseimaritima ulvae]|uniref:Uncharacterized protein n=1 Tax=Roseimaritima ulvae TaxID=980254 RepID=A0A5B9R697_9BACT|nr:hypothetical protein [Roseimaritima ulvae]QEG41773.1 hypothetical protein UC8_37990 [Roseimaritima ulvae]
MPARLPKHIEQLRWLAIGHSGICLRQIKARTLSMVVAVLNCLQFPLGTALGVLTIIALFQDPVREAYESGGEIAVE